MKPSILAAVSLAGAACIFLSTAAFADEACLDAWKSDVQRLVNARCVACHQNASPAGDLSLQRGSAPENLIGEAGANAAMPYITPGDPEQSYLFHKLSGTQIEAGGTGERMPLGGQLSDEEMATVETWIRNCADE